MANEGTVQPSIETDESMTLGLIQRGGGGSGRSRAPAVHRPFYHQPFTPSGLVPSSCN